MASFAEYTKKKKEEEEKKSAKGKSFTEYTKAVLGRDDIEAPLSETADDIAPIASFATKRSYEPTSEYKQDRLNALSGDVYDAPLPEGLTPISDEELDSKKRTWFQKGAFGDGNVGKGILGTLADFAEDATTGILGMGEKIVDGLATLGPYMARSQVYESGIVVTPEAMREVESIIESSKKSAAEFTAKDLYDENKVAKQILSGTAGLVSLKANMHKEDGIARAYEAQEKTLEYLNNQMEKDSVLGAKSDALVQSAGQLAATTGLQAIGVPWWLTTGATAYGSEAENALRNGATLDEAALSATISAGAEVLLEKLSGGIKFGGKALDDALTYQLAKRVSNKFVRIALNGVKDVAGEGAEEWITEDISKFGQWLTYRDEEELKELLFSEAAMDEKIEAFIGGAALGGVSNAGKTVNSLANGVDPVTNLTKNEQKVVDREVENRVVAQEKDGAKLTSKQKANIREQAMSDLKKGYISTDTIESVLGGETFNRYKSLEAQETALQEEISQLENKPKEQITVKEAERLTEAREELKNLDKIGLKTQLSEEVFNLAKNDSLVESYNEGARRGEAFTADLTAYDEKQKPIIQKAIDSGFLNNTNRTHEFVDMVAKLSADKGVSFDFANNERLKASGFAVDGATVNGVITKDGITINIDSPKALNRVVGHEITHVLEGTELYTELQKAVFEYAKGKNDYQGRYDSIAKLYETIKGADIDAELTADLVGDYLFTDSDFVNNLSTKHRNVFQKIYDEIKYLCKIATAGSKEARELEKVKKAFDAAYRTESKAPTDTKYSLAETENGIDNEQNLVYNGKRGELYVRTDEFRSLQAEGQRMSDEELQAYHSGERKIDETLRGRLSGVLERQVGAVSSGNRNGNGLLKLNSKENQFNIYEGVNGSLFHDCFEIARRYLENGELVDLHSAETTEDGIGYNDCYNYLSEDGLSGFSITPDGDLISVFNASGKRGFLRAIKPIIKQKAQTLDCYASENQNLMVMYSKIFGFKAASVMDYNMEYDHDNIAENHKMPKIAFMVNTESDVEVKEFTKDEYDEAVAYRNSFVKQATDNEVASFMSENSTALHSLSAENEQQKTYGNYNIFGKDLMLEKAPEQESTEVAPVVEKTAETVTTETAPEFAPTTAEAVTSEAPALTDADAPMDDIAPVVETAPVAEKYEAIRPQRPKQTVQEAQEPQPRMVRADNTKSAKGEMRSWAETSTESETLNGEIDIEELDQELIHYQPISNKKTLEKANAQLSAQGYDNAITYFKGRVTDRKASVEDIVLGERLVQEATKRGDKAAAMDLIQDIAILGTELGQKVQALSIIQRLTPEGQLKMLHRVIERGKATGDKAFEGVEVTQGMVDKISSAYDANFEEAVKRIQGEINKLDGVTLERKDTLKVNGANFKHRSKLKDLGFRYSAKDKAWYFTEQENTYSKEKLDAAMEEVKQELADQMKVTAGERINAWRYLAMLGNPKTHIRNIVSNVAMAGTIEVKNAMARTAEDIFLGNAEAGARTKTWEKATAEVADFAKRTTEEKMSALSSTNKYSDTSDIKSRRKMFGKLELLNRLDEINGNALSGEDKLFKNRRFEATFREYLTANGIKTEADIQNNPEIVAKAEQYAEKQALIATFQQDSWLADQISKIEKKNAAFGVAVGSILPFKKTPINIAKTALNYSPLGAIKTAAEVKALKNGDMAAAEWIDHLAQNITGTALTVLGYLLAESGVLTGAGDDDKEGKYDYQLGEQGYALKIGDQTYSLSWLTPVSMPLFVGANAYEQLVEDKGWSGDVVMETLAQTLDPLSEMSFLSGLDNVLSSYDSGIEKFMGAGVSAIQNYATQFVPTALSQVAAITDDTKRSTKVAADSGFKMVDETVNKIKYKIPGLRNTLEPSTDIWGNEIKQSDNVLTRAFESAIAPYARKENIATEIDAEIKELYGETGDDGLIPSVPDNYVNYNGEKYNMSAEEYTDFKKTYGQTAYEMLEELFETTTYQNSTSEERAELVNRVYDYARDQAKLNYLAQEGVDYTNATVEGEEVYKDNAIKGAIENDMILNEFDMFANNPKKYEFLQTNGISYEEYSASEESKELYDWAYRSPKRMTYAKAVGGLETYRTYYDSISEIKEKVGEGEKEAVKDYIFSLNIDYGERIILYRSMYESKEDRANYNADILDYLNSREDISYEDTVAILEELGFTVDENGYARWE